jgi:hypothetical protein
VDQPQSAFDIQPVVEALRRLDHRLDVRWNPAALIVRHGAIDANGKTIPPSYDGRWEVVIYETDMSVHGREFAVVYQVRGEHEEYKPIGMWLVEFMQRWDAAQSDFRENMDQMWAENDALESANDAVEDGAIREAVDRGHFAAYARGGKGTWQGQGADFAAMAAKVTSPPNGQSALIKQ